MTLRPSARLALAVTVGAVTLTMVASPALAQTTTSTGINVGSIIQNVIGLLTNNVVRGLAIIAVIVTGITTMFGHLDLRRAGTVILGIIVIFSAATIVDQMTGSGSGS
jgi:type IV secretory pathway VirB2 component (pilin)